MNMHSIGHGALATAKWIGVVVVGLLVVLVVGLVVVPPLGKPLTSRWGATDAELAETLPGDELVPAPRLSMTQAITIDAPAELVNQLVRQQGYKRAGWHGWDGFYDATGSSDFVDGHYSTRVVPELQGITVGDRVEINKMVGYEVVTDDRPSAFVLYGGTGADGESIHPGDPLPAKHTIMSWAWITKADGPDRTRLVLRLRSEMQQQGAFVTWLFDQPLEFGGHLFAHKTLGGIKATAESLSAAK
jgi:hypothetical protein